MKRKERMKRALALTLSAAMAVGNMPAMAYASEVVENEDGGVLQTVEVTPSEDEAVNEDASEDLDVQQAEPGQDEIIQVEGDTQLEEPIEIDNSVEEDAAAEMQMADQGIQVMTADDGEADTSEKTAEQIEAENYLKTNYIDGTNKAILYNSTKSENGLTYTIGLKTPSGYANRSIKLKYEDSSSQYITGWYIEENDYLSQKDPATDGKISIEKRPVSSYSFKATLKLFAKGTDTSAINAGTATALATQEFTFILEAEEAAESDYTMTVKVQDKSGNPISDADIALNKGSDAVDLTDGSYVMEKGANYTLTVKKTGYDDYTENISDFNPTDTNTVKTITLIKKTESKIVKFVAIDSVTKQVIPNAAITVKKDYYTSITPDSDGSYNLIKGTTYKYTVEATNYKTILNQDFIVGNEDTITIELTKDISKYTVSFKPIDTDGTIIANASVIVTYEDEDDLEDPETVTLTPNKDGSYTMDKSTTYTYTVKADGYKDAEGTYKPSGTEEVIELPVTMQKDAVDVTECKVTVQPVDSKTKESIANSTIKVTYEDYSTYYENPYTAELKANEDGTYTMKKDVEYTCAATADGYEAGTATYTPDGKVTTATVSVSMVKKPVDTKDQKTVDAIKAKFDAELGALRPNFATDTNILDIVGTKITGYTDIDTTGVTVSIKSSDDEEWISTNGSIHYKAEAPDQWGYNYKNVGIVYIFEKNGAKAETKSRTATIGWNRDYYNAQMKAEKEDLTWDKIKGANTDATDITSNLTLPQCMSSSRYNAWSKITWTSSNEDVISIEKSTEWEGLTDPKTGVIHQPKEDTKVTLTATFKANLVTDSVEKVSDFATYTIEFKVTVKGSGATTPTKEELQKLLDAYYTADRIEEFNVSGKVADLKNCKTDLQLPRVSAIKDSQGNGVFENKEISITADAEVLTVNGRRVAVDRFASNDDITANLIITFTREGITVSKKIPVTIKPITEAEVQSELNMMEVAKAHYFDGLNDGRYADKGSITGNLHPFQEMILNEDGTPKWIYNNDDKTGKGIIADDMFTDTWEMEGAGYNKFKSSNNAVVQHENLVVTRRETDTEITISSVLSSELYRDVAKAHPDNTLLQKLYKQPVSVTVTIQGTKPSVESLQKKIEELKEFRDSITEGNGAGQHPTGTKDKLQAAITEAEAVLNNESATDAEVRQEIKKLEELLKTVRDSQNVVEATVTAKINTVAGAGMDVSKMTVKADTAENYGYTKPESCKNKVTALDVLVAWHIATYGDDFKNNPVKYLIVNGGVISKIYGVSTYAVGILVNNQMPGGGTLTIDQSIVENGNIVTIFRYGDEQNWQDLYLYFEGMPETVKVNEAFNLTLYGVHPMKYDAEGNSEAASVKKGFTVAALDAMGRQVATAVTDENGAVTLQINTAGTYQITVLGTAEDYNETAMIIPQETIVVTGTSDTPAAHIHSFGEWRTVSAATVFAAEQQERICACGEKETRTVGTPLKATIKVNMSSVPLKVKQTTTKLKVSGLANGDAVASYTSSNKKVFTVDKNGKIKAGKKKGSAKLTITLKSGLKKTITIKVQKTTVKTRKIQGLQKTITLKKGTKTTLKPVLNPLTSQQKIKYTSSKKKVATVSSKGVIKAKKAGKTTITVKSGSKKYKITVKVK